MKIEIESKDISSVDGNLLCQGNAVLTIFLENEGKVELHVNHDALDQLELGIKEAKHALEKWEKS